MFVCLKSSGQPVQPALSLPSLYVPHSPSNVNPLSHTLYYPCHYSLTLPFIPSHTHFLQAASHPLLSPLSSSLIPFLIPFLTPHPTPTPSLTPSSSRSPYSRSLNISTHCSPLLSPFSSPHTPLTPPLTPLSPPLPPGRFTRLRQTYRHTALADPFGMAPQPHPITRDLSVLCVVGD